MRITYFDCSSGIAGNMVLGALIDAGLSPIYLKSELKKLPLKNYALKIKKVRRHGIAATQVEIEIKKELQLNSPSDIVKIINRSRLSKSIKQLSIKIFRRILAAEQKVHAQHLDKLHLHELGSIDTIIDIVGAVIGLKKLGIQQIYSSPLHVGKGRVKYAHGRLPVPSPAASILLKGIPIYSQDVEGELVTPTGAAIISTLAHSFGALPKLKIDKIGYGAGTHDFGIPNLLRIFIGEAQLPTLDDTILQIETNIDDMDPRRYDAAIKKIMAAGALDCWITPIRMKKKRAAFALCVMARPEDKDRILDTIFTVTTSIGCRVYAVTREILSRKIFKLKTKYGTIRTKASYLGKTLKNISLEADDCQNLKQLLLLCQAQAGGRDKAGKQRMRTVGAGLKLGMELRR
ncbi:MAG: nickel pincer cofactor biosynthesis protein LarC [Candidatus Margulisiibacteriota bacterium]